MIAWTDVESTGLDAVEDHLLEVALVITDDELNERAATSVVVRPVGVTFVETADGTHIPDVPMDDVVREMHTKNGLFEEVYRSELHRYEGELQLLKFLVDAYAGVPDVATEKCVVCGSKAAKHTRDSCDPSLFCKPGDPYMKFQPKMVSALSSTPLAGSTVGFDRVFLREHMPALLKSFSYRSIDVSSLTELAGRWAPPVYAGRPKADATSSHRALADIRESIDYLRYYRSVGFIAPPPSSRGWFPLPLPPVICVYCGTMVPAESKRCLNCERKLTP